MSEWQADWVAHLAEDVVTHSDIIPIRMELAIRDMDLTIPAPGRGRPSYNNNFLVHLRTFMPARVLPSQVVLQHVYQNGKSLLMTHLF